ncbi:MAG: helix-turn-helix protein [Acidobacteriota bacterium]|nr:helix-turn-helix protein [Acidobacteriota bacterium]
MTERRSPEELRVAITFLRSLHGWSQARLATELGVSTSSISRYENGETVPPQKMWDQLVVNLGLPPSCVACLFTLIRTVRTAIENPSSVYDPAQTIESIARRVADRVYEIILSAAAAILDDLPKSGDGWWDEEGQEPS